VWQPAPMSSARRAGTFPVRGAPPPTTPGGDEAAPSRRARDGARAAAPLAVAVLGFGVSYGVLARAVDMGALAPIVMSMTTFAGSAQFAAVSVLGAGGGLAAAIVAAIMLNARYAPIGISVAPAFDGPLWRRVLGAQMVVDESWALGQVAPGRYDRERLVGAGVMLWLAWSLGTVIGVLGAGFIGDPEALGLDAAFPALFLALLAPQLGSRRARAAALLGGAIALVLVPVAPPGVPIIAAAAACALGLRG
jgi:4-azaleucine resistance transporter AzlC